jgi:hypothetical protein
VTRISLPPRAWVGLTAGFLIITALLVLTAVTLISQRQRTVILNRQLGTLVGEATLALHGLAPVLDAVPGSGSTIRSRADAAAGLVSAARPLVGQLSATELPETVAAAGGLIDDIDHYALVSRLDALLEQVPAGSALIGQLRRLLLAVGREGLVPGIAGGLQDLRALVALEARTLATQQATLRNGRQNHSTAQQTLSATRQALQATRQALQATRQTVALTRQTVALTQQTLSVAQQTLVHAASLDRKVGPVP